MSHYEIRNIKTGETVVLIARSKSGNPEYRAKETFARMEKAAGKGNYELVEVGK